MVLPCVGSIQKALGRKVSLEVGENGVCSWQANNNELFQRKDNSSLT
jgi:hypothetical protein